MVDDTERFSALSTRAEVEAGAPWPSPADLASAAGISIVEWAWAVYDPETDPPDEGSVLEYVLRGNARDREDARERRLNAARQAAEQAEYRRCTAAGLDAPEAARLAALEGAKAWRAEEERIAAEGDAADGALVRRKMRAIGWLLGQVAQAPPPSQCWAAHDARVSVARGECRERLRQRLRGMSVPPKDIELIATGGIQETVPVAWLRRQTGRTIMVLAGEPGTGKTTAAAWWLSQQKTGAWLSASELQSVGIYDHARRRELAAARTLVIDDLGTEFSDKGGVLQGVLDGLINARYEAGRETLITTNLDRRRFRERYGDRIDSRIDEAGAYRELGDAVNLRRRKGAA